MIGVLPTPGHPPKRAWECALSETWSQFGQSHCVCTWDLARRERALSVRLSMLHRGGRGCHWCSVLESPSRLEPKVTFLATYLAELMPARGMICWWLWYVLEWPTQGAPQGVGARACQYVPTDPGNMQSGIYVNVCFDSIAISMNAAENQNKKSHLTSNQMNVIQHSKFPGSMNRIL
jgi:hypothetical protein